MASVRTAEIDYYPLSIPDRQVQRPVNRLLRTSDHYRDGNHTKKLPQKWCSTTFFLWQNNAYLSVFITYFYVTL
jgi:hypothetical protein